MRFVSGELWDIGGANKKNVITGVSANKHGGMSKKEMVPRARIELATRGFLSGILTHI